MADLRQACDRCHDKKLRCPKSPGSNACSRCLKAHVLCVFSPPTKPSSVTPRRDAPHPLLHDNGLHAGEYPAESYMRPDWADLMDFDPVVEPLYDGGALAQDPFNVGQSMCLLSQASNSHTASAPSSNTQVLPPSPPTQDGSSSGADETTRRLTSAIIDLDALGQRLAPARNHHVPKEHIQQWADQLRDEINLRSALEGILTHTQGLTSLYSNIEELTSPEHGSPPDHDDNCQVPNCIHDNEHQLPDAPGHYAMVNLLLTSHLKLIDTLDILIRCSRTCSHVVMSLPKSQEPRFDIPEIRIGSFVAPEGAAASLFTTMLHQLLSDLQGKNKGLSAQLSARNDLRGSREVRVVGLQSEIIRDRTSGILDELQRVKTEMINLGIIRFKHLCRRLVQPILGPAQGLIDIATELEAKVMRLQFLVRRVWIRTNSNSSASLFRQ